MLDIWRSFLLATGVIACPCHFPITLPLLIGALGATGVGAALADHAGWVYVAGWAYFVTAVAVGILSTRSSKRAKSRPIGGGPTPLELEKGSRARPVSRERLPQ